MAKPKRPAKNNAMIVVGIGASAGGLGAYRAFFEKMPPESGMAFVVVQHLDPVHKSEIAELLGRCTEMPVVAASNAMAVEADHVYVIPPNKALSIGNGRLWLSVPAEARGRRLPIDYFFQSLAAEYQERGIGIVLSGTGSDGTLGMGAIKAAGGLTLVQDPISAEHDGMPRSAIGAGAADDVMPVEQMPAALIKYAQHPYIHGAAGAAPLQKGGEDQFLGILSLVRARTKFDFGSYKQGTLRRRVHRRMSLRHITRFSEYMDLLRRDSDEVQALIKDLLISVTHFFRDPEAWKYLQEHAIRPLVRQWTSDDPIRAWVAGCATGEEAYSVAMTLLDELTAVRKPCGVQVFASDVSREAIATARMGIYPESLAAEVSPARLKRYFIQQEGHYRIRGELRDAVVFAEHNLLFDPPFSKLDLITCRNLLIYLDGEAQKKVMPLFHYALCPGGYLFLGSAETVGERHDLFRSVSRKWRIYRRVGPVRPELLPFPIDSGQETTRATAANLDRTGRTPRSRFVEMAQDLILNRYAPASVVINRKHEILYTCGPTQDYLKQPAGVMQTDLLSWAQDILRARLRAALREVHATDKTVKLPDLRVRRGRAIRSASVTIEPLHSPRQADGLILVTFQTPAKARAAGVAAPVQNGGAGGGGAEAGTSDPNDALVRQLEDELQTTQDDLKGTIEQLEAANEELKASNEEGISSNEELQSSNEELETSKEELQSLNEELSTVNGQLQAKVEELESKTNDLNSLLSSTDIATVFLDRELQIKWFTPATTRLLRLRPSDIGRPIGDFSQKFTGGDLQADAEAVLQRPAPVEQEIRGPEGRWYLRRVLPYHAADGRIQGVVMTFVDIHRSKQAEEKLLRMAVAVRDSNDAVTVHDFEGRLLNWNHGAELMFGYTEAEAMRRNALTLAPPARRAEMKALFGQLKRDGKSISLETQRRIKGGKILDVWLTITAVQDDQGRPTAIATTERDITDRKRDEAALRELNQTLEARISERTAVAESQAARLRELAAQLLAAEDEERRSLATDLHDNLAQVLYVAKMKLAEVRHGAAAAEQARLAEIEKMLANANQTIRSLSYQLSPPVLHELGLIPALEWLAEEMKRQYHLTVKTEIAGPMPVVEARTRTILFRAVRELLINVAKHAGVHRAMVRISESENHVTIVVEDNGAGFDPRVLRSSSMTRGFGLFSIRERLDYLGGKLEIQSRRGKKTTVTITMPLAWEDKRRGGG